MFLLRDDYVSGVYLFRFTPEVLGMQASSALVWLIIEVLAILLTTYITNIHTALRKLDLIAFCGYKYVGWDYILKLWFLFRITMLQNKSLFCLQLFKFIMYTSTDESQQLVRLVWCKMKSVCLYSAVKCRPESFQPSLHYLHMELGWHIEIEKFCMTLLIIQVT